MPHKKPGRLLLVHACSSNIIVAIIVDTILREHYKGYKPEWIKRRSFVKITNVREFRNKATAMLRQEEPIIITRHGKVVGLFLPLEEPNRLPVELRKELLRKFGEYISKSLEMKGATEGEVLENFEGFSETILPGFSERSEQYDWGNRT